MAIPNSFSSQLISGNVGEVAFSGARRVVTATINSTTETNNVFGRVFTYSSTATETVQAGGAGAIAGILVHPKAHAIDADYMFNGSVGEFAFEGEFFLDVGAAAAVIGSKVYYVNATGALGIGTASAGQTQLPNAQVVRHDGSPTAQGNVLAVVAFNFLPVA